MWYHGLKKDKKTVREIEVISRNKYCKNRLIRSKSFTCATCLAQNILNVLLNINISKSSSQLVVSESTPRCKFLNLLFMCYVFFIIYVGIDIFFIFIFTFNSYPFLYFKKKVYSLFIFIHILYIFL